MRTSAKTAAEGQPEPELTLFDSYDELDPMSQVEFYQHQESWKNRMILGDSLQVMGSLAEREGLRGKVQMIYIDPPYGIKFGSNWQVSARKRDVKDGNLADAARRPNRSRHSGTPGNWASTPTWPTCATGSWWPAIYSPSPAASLCRSGTRTSTSFAHSWMRCLEARTP